MREIKFRAWDKKHTSFLRGNHLLLALDGQVMLDAEQPSVEPGRYILQQYTGLKDKNGKEIYEGDILLIPDEWTEPVLDDGSGPREPCNHLAPVTFMEGGFGITITDRADIYSKGFWSFQVIIHEVGDKPEEFEVIGNIYENPELLEKK